MAARRWRKCSSTWCAAAPSAEKETAPGRRGRRHERGHLTIRRRRRAPAAVRPRRFAPPHRRDGAALHLSPAELRHQAARADLLALPADAHLGLPAEISRRHHEPARAGRRRADRRGAAVGHSLPLQDRLLHDLHRGDVVAQSRQSAHEPAPSLRARRRLERVERAPPRREHGPGRRRRLFHLRLQPARSRGWRSSPSSPCSC